MKYKSDELQVFLAEYNRYQNTVTTPFKMKIGAATGTYYKFGVGMGDNRVQMVVDLAISNVKTNPLEARFGDGSGRDIWVEHRNSNSVVGVRFGGSKQYPAFVQFNMNLGVQQTYVYSAYVYPDGSRSLGLEKTLNGVYGDFSMAGGLGLGAGYRIIGPLAFYVSADYLWNGGKKNPQYHQYIDLNDVKPTMTQDYLPRNMDMYVNDPYNSIDNSISNDFRGWKFACGLSFIIGNWED